VVVPELIAASIATWIGRKADKWGRKKLLIAGFAALPVRAILFALAPGPWFLVCVQPLGGLTAAVIGIMTPLVVADLTRYSARYNFSLGSVRMISGIGATISTTGIGFLSQELGVTIGFIALALVALAGLVTIWHFIPETMHIAREVEQV
jgi:MFS family permease